jgi:hypothetical protein
MTTVQHGRDRFTYVQRMGHLFFGPALVSICYSGHLAGLNNPGAEGEKDIGPIPAGDYLLTDVHDSLTTGPLSIRLAPDAKTRVRIVSLGRAPDSFLIHGSDVHDEDHHSSHGCVVASRQSRESIIAAMSDPTVREMSVIAECDCSVCSILAQ